MLRMRHLLEAFLALGLLFVVVTARAATPGRPPEPPVAEPGPVLPRFDEPTRCDVRSSGLKGPWCTPTMELVTCDNGVVSTIRRRVRTDHVCVVEVLVYPPGHPDLVEP